MEYNKKMELFIDLIRQLPCLWDLESREYRDMRKKHAAWKKVILELKSEDIQDIRSAKAEWKKLRDSHRDSLKRIKSLGPNQDASIVNKWKYAEQMAFLLPYMRTRKKNWTSAVSSDDNNDQSPSPSDSFVAAPTTSNADNITFSPDPQDQSNVDTTEDDNKISKKKVENEFNEIMIDMDDRTRVSDKTRHPLDSFFESMCETTKQFPTWLQYSVKRKIFTVVSEAEDTFESYKTREPIF